MTIFVTQQILTRQIQEFESDDINEVALVFQHRSSTHAISTFNYSLMWTQYNYLLINSTQEITMPIGKSISQIGSQNDIVYLDSEEKMNNFLELLEKTINDCADLSSFLKTNPLLFPIVFCYFTNEMLSKLDDNSLTEVLNANPLSCSIFGYAVKLKKNTESDSKLINDFSTLLLSFINSEIKKLDEFKFINKSLHSIVKELLLNTNLNFKRIGKIHLNLIIKINQYRIGEYLDEINIDEDFKEITNEYNIQEVKAYFCKYVYNFFINKNFLTNYIQSSKNTNDIYYLCSCDNIFTEIIANITISDKKLFLSFFSNYEKFIKLFDRFSYFYEDEYFEQNRHFNKIKVVYEKLRDDLFYLLEFIDSEESFNNMRQHAKHCDIQFTEFGDLVHQILQVCKQKNSLLVNLFDMLESLLNKKEQTRLYFSTMSELSLVYQLLRLVSYSYRIVQKDKLCAPTAFFKILVDCYPVETVQMMIEFAYCGKAAVPGLVISAKKDCDTTSIVQNFIVALRDSSSLFGYRPDSYFKLLQGSTSIWQLSDWLNKFGFSCKTARQFAYSHKILTVNVSNFFRYTKSQRESIDSQLKLNFLVKNFEKQSSGTSQKILLQISSELNSKITGAKTIEDSTLFGIRISSHVLELLDLQVQDSSILITVYNYGQIYENIILSREEFQEGVIEALFLLPNKDLKLEANNKVDSDLKVGW